MDKFTQWTRAEYTFTAPIKRGERGLESLASRYRVLEGVRV